MEGLASASAVELAGLLKGGEISSRDLLEHFLARVAAHNPSVNAVVTVDAERAKTEADAADAALAEGRILGPLHGLPVTVKDQFATAGMRTTIGAREFRDWVPSYDCLPVARLRAAGAVIFAKTNLPPYAIDIQTHNDVFGTTNNPWDLALTPGGSSGGSAAALAAGMTALDLGSDIGGSIRTPAHYCGVYGHKPTYGVVPNPPAPGARPGYRAEHDIATPGPLARQAEDLDLALEVIAGPEPARAKAWRLDLPPPRHSGLQEFRVAAWLDDPDCPTDPEVLIVLRELVAKLRAAGVTVDERARPGFRLANAFREYQRLLYGTLAHGLPFAALLPYGRALFRGDSQLARVCRFGSARHREWILAHEAREDYRRAWAEFFATYDVVLCPVTPTAAVRHNHTFGPAIIFRSMRGSDGRRRSYMDQMVWAGAIGMAYLPATVAPVGSAPSGLPVGVQIVGDYLEDRTTIAFAEHLSAITGGFRPPPGFE